MPKKSSKKPTISFQEKVYKAVKKIPKGKTLSYKEIAKLVGKPRAWRAVGNILNKNPVPEPSARYGADCNPKIPCHRVIRSDGKIGGYNRGIKNKIALLKKEGLIIKRGRIFNPSLSQQFFQKSGDGFG